MNELRVEPQTNSGDPDERVLSAEDLKRAVEEGERKAA
jgi:hypothetical protein